jgi:hypothetical protein
MVFDRCAAIVGTSSKPRWARSARETPSAREIRDPYHEAFTERDARQRIQLRLPEDQGPAFGADIDFEAARRTSP